MIRRPPSSPLFPSTPLSRSPPRYTPSDARPAGRSRYPAPADLGDALRQRYVATLDRAFDTYRAWLPRMRAFYETKYPRAAAEADTVYRMTIRDGVGLRGSARVLRLVEIGRAHV